MPVATRLFALCAVLLLAALAGLPVQAQTLGWWLGGNAQAQTTSAPATPAENAPDYDEWAKVAARAEGVTEDNRASNPALEVLRGQLTDWRGRFLAAQNTNLARIETLRAQIAALGPAPADGVTEATEIADRRKTLDEQLTRLQAPGIAADEAYRRADGLIREIDTILRERQADELLRLLPMPVNPANWPDAAAALRDISVTLWTESVTAWGDAGKRSDLWGNLPLLLALVLFAAAVLARGRRWVERLTLHLQARASARGREVWALVLSLGQIVLPTLGVLALSVALQRSQMLGPLGGRIADVLPAIGATIFAAAWLGGRIFPKLDVPGAPLRLTPDQRAEGRVYTTLFGMLVGFEAMLNITVDPLRATDAALSVLNYPVLVVAGLLLVRMGQLLRRQSRTEEAVPPRDTLIGLLGRGAIAVGVVGVLLATVGYVPAAQALVYPGVITLGLMGLLLIVQKLIGDIYEMIVGSEEAARDALIPVLISFTLSLATLPLLALIWGARTADLSELWTRFREGFTIGEARLSPTDFVLFLVIFGIGFGLTRLLQGVLKASVLPKTSLDAGGRNAIVAGVGYVGIFLAALAAITSTGIDLSSLAIVAGALSVGIGFGLQNIVSNFVSGIILLIERPVAEGDWIEVGGVQGRVRAISVRSTRIETFDRSDVIVPNADLISGRVTNWTGFNLTGRLIVPVGVGYGSDTRKVERILREIAEAQPMVMLNPPPTIIFMGFGADSLNFEIRVILRDVNFSLSVRSEINHQIAARFAEEGIEIPFAQRDIWLRNPEALQGLPRAVPPAPPEPAAPGSRMRADETTTDDFVPGPETAQDPAVKGD
jgi:small-conductance mechanosensitive channel